MFPARYALALLALSAVPLWTKAASETIYDEKADAQKLISAAITVFQIAKAMQPAFVTNEDDFDPYQRGARERFGDRQRRYDDYDRPTHSDGITDRPDPSPAAATVAVCRAASSKAGWRPYAAASSRCSPGRATSAKTSSPRCHTVRTPWNAGPYA